jgi:hypothetical protein
MSTATYQDPEPDQQVPAGQVGDPMRAARRPISAGFLSVMGIIWSVLVIALAVVCIRDALVALDAVGGRPWITGVTEWFDGTLATRWMYAIGIGCIVLGLLLLIPAVRPRPRRGIEVDAQTSVLVSKSALRRLATSSARDLDGVDTVSVRASRTWVKVDATVLSSSRVKEVEAAIAGAVIDRLSSLRDKPGIRVRATSVGGEQ